ncbi:MAG: DsbA family protein [Pseudomonadota bacterium]
MLTVYIDFKSPGAYLAMKPTLALAERLGLQVVWRPYRTVERDVPKLGKEETVGESHRRVRAASQRALMIKYAGLQGIDLKYPARLGETDLALGVFAQIAGDPLPFIRAAFAGYWEAHADLNDPDTVRSLIAHGGGLDERALASASAALEQATAEADEIGIVGAPGYVIANQIFVGREHLPWIEEIARGTRARDG